MCVCVYSTVTYGSYYLQSSRSCKFEFSFFVVWKVLLEVRKFYQQYNNCLAVRPRANGLPTGPIFMTFNI
jgi:hypothetical protein